MRDLGVDRHRRGRRQDARPHRFHAGARAYPRRGRRIRLRQVDLGARDPRPAAGGRADEDGDIRFEARICWLGERELNRRIRGRRIGFIPQDPYLALNPVFNVGTQLLEIMRWHGQMPAMAARGRGRPPRTHRDRIVQLLRRVQMPDPEAALERYPHQFSGGQRQRLLIAAALACSPALVIADEPTTALDVTTQQQILDLLRDLVAEFGLSMLFVTHDLGVVAQLCDDLCVIYAGPDGRARPDRRDPRRAAPPLHPRSAGLPSRSRRLVHRHSRHGALAAARRTGLPFRAALPERASGLRRAPSASGTRTVGAAGRLRAASSGGNPGVMTQHVAARTADVSVLLGGERRLLRKLRTGARGRRRQPRCAGRRDPRRGRRVRAAARRRSAARSSDCSARPSAKSGWTAGS